MIYEAFNESLDNMRPFGVNGKPMPWKVNSQKINITKIDIN